MDIKEFTADRQAKMKRVDDLRKQIEEDQDRLEDLEQAYNTALVEGNDNEADKLFPQFTSLKDKIKSDNYKADKLKALNAKAIKENAEKTIFHLKDIYEDYQKKAEIIDKEMVPVEKKVLALHQEAFELQQEFGNIKNDYLKLVDLYKFKSATFSNKGVPAPSTSLPVFKQTHLRPNDVGFRPTVKPTVKAKTFDELKSERLKELPDTATMAEIAKASRIIGGE